MSGKLIINGTIVQAAEKIGDITIIPNAWIGVDESTGEIAFVETSETSPAVQEWLKAGSARVERVEPPRFIVPGLIDAHIHAPQYSFSGVGTNIPLLDWLNTYTFPFESKFSDLEWAQRVYDLVVHRTLSCGTTTASYFATVHYAASILLARICATQGQRAFIGKVNMDRNSPDFYKDESSAESARLTEEFVRAVNDMKSPVVAPIVTPRFVPTCTSGLMRDLGAIAARHGDNMSLNKTLAIQSHVSENTSEIAWVAELHPESSSYTDVYDKHNLLTRRTILAHGVHLKDDELRRFAEVGASIVHCPLSNFSLTSGVCPVRRCLKFGVNVALGTDVCGGGSPSLLNAMKNAIVASQVTTINHAAKEDSAEFKPLSWKEALYLATRGGAKALDIENVAGAIEKGKKFDALVIDPAIKGDALFDLFGWESTEQIAEKFFMVGDDRNVTKVFVNGKLVISK